jgi:hypothetical protein
LCEQLRNNDSIVDQVDFCLLPLQKKSDIVKRQAEISYAQNMKKREEKYLSKHGIGGDPSVLFSDRYQNGAYNVSGNS